MRQIAWERWVDFEQDIEETDEDEDMRLVPLMIRTPLGMFNPSESMSPNKMFDCWVLHTNFPITHREQMILDNIEGIEIIKIMTKYRVFIGIGKLFNLTNIRPKIELAMEITKESSIAKIMQEIEGKDKWAVAIYSDGKHKTIFPVDGRDFEEDIEILRSGEAANIITSDEF
jgi:hypothetical protein